MENVSRENGAGFMASMISVHPEAGPWLHLAVSPLCASILPAMRRLCCFQELLHEEHDTLLCTNLPIEVLLLN